MFNITIRATSILITPGQDALQHLQPLLTLHEYEDEYQETVNVLGYMYDEAHDTLYFHKGLDIEYLRRLLGETEIKYDLYHPYREMNYEFEEVFSPRDEDQVNYINFIAGEKEYASNADDSQIFLVATTGSGKMEPISRKIPTPTPGGFTLMGDLKIGDFVFDEHGNPTKVIGIFDHGMQMVYEITFADNRTAYCGKDHLWKVFVNGRDEPCVVDTKTLRIMYRRRRTNPDGNRDMYIYNCSIPVCEPLDYPHQDVPIDPWVLGCFIGNGCCREQPLTISCIDDEIPSRIAKICGFNFEKSCDGNYSYIFRYKDGKRVQTTEFFKDIPEIISAYSCDKCIPTSYMYNDQETRLSLIQGLMDTDGCIDTDYRHRVSYCSTSYKLLEQLQWLVYSFGWTGIIHRDCRRHKYRGGYCGQLTFRIPNTDKPKLFTIKKKSKLANESANTSQKDWYSNLIIKQIQFSHMENCRCIMVDNPSHLYLTEDCIVTHNTYCTGYGVGLFGVKTLIIMHRDNLRDQWAKSLYDLNGYGSKEVYQLTSTEEIEAIANGDVKYDYDIYLMTHATFRAACKRIGDCEKISMITRNLGIGFKVIDEAHLEFRDTLLMDFLLNVKRNLYLTATDGRSSRDENAIFRHVFSNTTFYRKMQTSDENHPSKWVEYITVDINTHLNPNIYRYRVNGGRGMSAISYGKWVIQHDKKHTHFKVCRDIIKDIFTNEPMAKVLVFLPLIDLCTDCAYFLTMELDKDESFDYSLDIKTVNSHNSKSENEMNKRADVIVTTVQSLGTGSDIKGVTDIIICSPIVSKIVVKQVFGRIRYINKPCHYYDIVDQSVQADCYWWKSRKKTLKSLATKYTHLTWTEGDGGT